MQDFAKAWRPLLLTLDNPKIIKNNHTVVVNGRPYSFMSAILHLAPARESGFNTCPRHTPACAAACLYFSGRGAMRTVQDARIARTKLFFENRKLFLRYLELDLQMLCEIAAMRGAWPLVRLNGTSDIVWERIAPHLFDYPAIFYDYTKIPRRNNLPLNYRLTFSYDGSNLAECEAWLASGRAVAVVFRGELPLTWRGFPVIDGDRHDLRFFDAVKPVVIGLRAKGRLRNQPSNPMLGDLTNA